MSGPVKSSTSGVNDDYSPLNRATESTSKARKEMGVKVAQLPQNKEQPGDTIIPYSDDDVLSDSQNSSLAASVKNILDVGGLTAEKSPSLPPSTASSSDLAAGTALIKKFSVAVSLYSNGADVNLEALVSGLMTVFAQMQSTNQASTEATLQNNQALVKQISANSDIMQKLSEQVGNDQLAIVKKQMQIDAKEKKEHSTWHKVEGFLKNTGIASAGFLVNEGLAILTWNPAAIVGGAVEFATSEAVLGISTFVNFDAIAAKKFPYSNPPTPENTAKQDAKRNRFELEVKSGLVATVIGVSITATVLSAGTGTASNLLVAGVVLTCLASSFASSVLQTGFSQNMINEVAAKKQQKWIKEDRAKGKSDEDVQNDVETKTRKYEKHAEIACTTVLVVAALVGGAGQAKLSSNMAKNAVSAEAEVNTLEAGLKAAKTGATDEKTASETLEDASEAANAGDVIGKASSESNAASVEIEQVEEEAQQANEGKAAVEQKADKLAKTGEKIQQTEKEVASDAEDTKTTKGKAKPNAEKLKNWSLAKTGVEAGTGLYSAANAVVQDALDYLDKSAEINNVKQQIQLQEDSILTKFQMDELQPQIDAAQQYLATSSQSMQAVSPILNDLMRLMSGVLQTNNQMVLPIQKLV